MDFGVWGPSKENMNQTDSQRSSSQPFQTASQPNSANGGGGDKSGNNNNGNGSNDEGVVLMHHMEHTGVVCDICDTTVCGFRYKCMQCPDFDLCHFCERKGHHAGHIMMRISFPEQAAEAIRRYISGNSTSPLRPPPFWGGFPTGEGLFPGHGGHHRGHGHRGDRGHHGRREAGRCGRDSSPENPDEPSGFGHGCPYQVSKKGMKKWAKCMKKAAHHHRRSAEAYATGTAAAAANGTESTPTAARENTENSGHGFDFTAAASQIQEFLNAWGVPIDVVELYDELGNRGQPTQPATANSSGQTQETGKTSPTTASQTQTAAGNANQTVLTEQLQQLNINSATVPETIPVATPVPQSIPSAPTMDTDGEPGWTLIDKVADGSLNRSMPAAPDSIEEVKHTAQVPVPTADILSSGIPSLPTVVTNAAETNNSIQNQQQQSGFPSLIPELMDTPVPVTATPTAVNSIPIYPPLNAMQNPQFQQMMQGVTNAVGSAIRNIPILPMGLASFPRPQQPGQPAAPPAPVSQSGNSIPELDAQSVTTLNQLLSMGFSNHDGWLARLVVAKKGDLEAVLNALFPGGAP